MNRRVFIVSLLILIMIVGCARIEIRGRREDEKISKRSVVVIPFKDKTEGTYGFWDIGKGIANELTSALVDSGNFIVIEKREKFKGEILEFSPQIISRHGAIIKRVLGVDAIITGDVNEFEIKEQEGEGRGRVRAMAEIAKVKLDIKIIDPETGNILFTETAEGEEVGRLIRRGKELQRMSFGDREFKKTTIGKAVKLAIDQAVEKVTKAFASYPYYEEYEEVKKPKKEEHKEPLKEVTLRGRIIKVVKDKFYINCGSSVGTKVGDIFTVYSLGEEIIDPLTGESLGFEMKKAGKIRVIEVQENYSVSVIESGQGFKVNDVVKVEK